MSRPEGTRQRPTARGGRPSRSAASVYRLYGERHQEARALEQLAQAVGWDDPAKGARLAERALGLIEPRREPRLELASRHALIWFLNDCGIGGQALDLLERTRPLSRECGESEARVVLPAVARICRGLGELAAAERELAAVRHAFRKAGFPRELTLVSLDLAEVYLAQGKGRHAMRLLRCFHGILGRWEMQTEGMAAWLLLVEAAAGEAGEAARYFRWAWRRGFGGGGERGGV